MLLLPGAAGPRQDIVIRRELRQAVLADDLARFDAALERAHAHIESMPLGPQRNALRRCILISDDIAKVWHFALSDEHGLYYDDERLPFFYDHLAADYPDYPKFIHDYRVLDRTGLPLYATRETRDFLLKRLENTIRTSP